MRRIAGWKSLKWNVWLPLVAAPFILLAPVWLSGKALFWGVVSLQFAPWRAYAYDLLRQGELPLWNPLAGMGAPLWANYQAGLGYPPNWLYLALQALGGAGWAAWGQALLIAAHLAWAGLGMAALARRMRLGGLAQAVSGLAFGLSGYLTARAGFLSINAAAAWTPWMLWGLEGVIHREEKGVGREELFLALIVAMQLLAGHAQTTWYSWLSAGMWLAWRLGWGGWRRLGRATIGRLAAAGMLGAGLAAYQWLPTAEYLLESHRAGGVDYDFALTYSFWPWRFLTLIAPNMFGNPAHGDYWGYGNFWEDAVYVGLLPLLMVCAAVWRGKQSTNTDAKKRMGAWVGFLLFLTFLSFLLALGGNTPAFPFLYRYVPTFDLFQAPTRYTLWAVVALALLAGVGAEGWRRPEGRRLYWTRLGTAGAFAVMIGAGAAWLIFDQVRLTFLSATALAGFWALGVGALALTAPRQVDAPGALAERCWRWGVVLWVCADLIAAAWGLNPGIARDFYTQANPAAEAARGGRVYLPAGLEYELKFNEFMRFDSFAPRHNWDGLRQSLLPNLNLYDQIASVNNFDPLQPGRYQRWMEALEAADEAKRTTALNLMAVSVVEHKDDRHPAGLRLEALTPASRFRWTPCGQPAPGEAAAWEIVWSGGLNFDQFVVIEGLENDGETPCTASVATGTIKVEQDLANHLALTVEAAQAGWLWIADVWYPGWRAWVDGEETDVYRANYLFRAIRLEAGRHKVSLAYQPVSFYAGAAVSGMALIVLLLTWLAAGRRQ